MKNKLFLALASAALLFAGCAKDQALYDKVDNLDKRVSVLEEQVKELNERTVPGLQATVAAIQNGVFVSKVVKTSEGYSIYFSDGTTAVLKNGDKGEAGEDAQAPVVSAKEVDGVFYWTVNGEIMKDANGNPVRVYSALPQFRINEGKWEVSYDEGATWTVVEVMGEATAVPISIVDGDTTVTFYIGEESYVIKKELPFYLTINVTDRKGVAVPQGEEYLYEYTLTGVQEGDEVEVDILSITAGWEARIVSLPQGDKSGWIGVKNIDNSDGKVFIYASNGKGKTDIKSLVFEGGVFEAEMDVQTIPAEGGEAVLTIVTNIDYELWKDPTAKWLTIPETKAVHTDVVTLVAEPNTTGNFRSAEVDLLLQNDTEAYMILQYPSQEEVTSIASLANVDNYVSVTLYNEPVVAASEWSVVVSDGTANLYVPFDHFDVGTILNITGFNSPDGFTVTNVTPVGEGGEVVETDFNYYAYGQIYSNIFTAINGTLEVEEGVYSIVNDYGEDGKVSVIIEAPVESLGFAEMTPGNLVAAKGYIVGYMDGENEGDQIYMMVAADANEAVLTETGAITYSNEGGDSFLWDYEKPYMQYAIYNSKIWDSFSTKEEIVLYTAKQEADDYQYDFLDGYSFLFTPAELAPLVLYSPGEVVEMSSELPYGEYVVVAVSMDEYGRLQGPYGYLEMEKVEPELPKAAYADFLGDWILGSDVITIAQKEAGKTYSVTGIKNQADKGVGAVEASYEDGLFIISEQATDATITVNVSGIGETLCDLYLSGVFTSGGKTYGYYPINADGDPQVIFKGAYENGVITVLPGECKYGKFGSMGISWVIREGENAGKGNTYAGTTLSATMTKMVDNIPDELLGNWICPSAEDYWGEDTYTNWTMTLAKSGVAVSIKGFDAGIEAICDANNLTHPVVEAMWDENAKTLTIANGTETGLASGGNSISWVGYDENREQCDIVYNVDLTANTLTLTNAMFFASSSTGSYSGFSAPLVFYKEGHVPASHSTCGRADSPRGAKLSSKSVASPVETISAKISSKKTNKVEKASAQVKSSAKLAKRTLSK
ncbi:MAG: PL29 family lyase N-terminal domain-containing protein [Bacteroidales bacterium]|nr:PL29 family lyase N-terminal domain-containing protein [Bacteroidales bacterium]